MCWQPALPLIQDADLVIVEMANKLLINYILLIQNALGVKKGRILGSRKEFSGKKGTSFQRMDKTNSIYKNSLVVCLQQLEC